MAIKSKAELLELVKGIIGEDTSENTLGFLEDLTDTLDNNKHDDTDWEQKYHDNDKAWSQKYRERFFSGTTQEEDEEETHDKKMNFSDLFTEEEK